MLQKATQKRARASTLVWDGWHRQVGCLSQKFAPHFRGAGKRNDAFRVKHSAVKPPFACGLRNRRQSKDNATGTSSKLGQALCKKSHNFRLLLHQVTCQGPSNYMARSERPGPLQALTCWAALGNQTASMARMTVASTRQKEKDETVQTRKAGSYAQASSGWYFCRALERSQAQVNSIWVCLRRLKRMRCACRLATESRAISAHRVCELAKWDIM